jgi:hypothetical protein
MNGHGEAPAEINGLNGEVEVPAEAVGPAHAGAAGEAGAAPALFYENVGQQLLIEELQNDVATLQAQIPALQAQVAAIPALQAKLAEIGDLIRNGN